MRTFASLSSSLLARKGGARPAMRPNSGKSLEDLGWNDMGVDTPAPVSANIRDVGLTPAPISYQAAIEESFAAPAELRPMPIAPRDIEKPSVRVAKKRASAPKPVVVGKLQAAERAQAKTAFTLRLDGARHIRLKLACVLTNRSAQKVVTQALDAYLAKMPEIDALAGHMPASRKPGHD